MPAFPSSQRRPHRGRPLARDGEWVAQPGVVGHDARWVERSADGVGEQRRRREDGDRPPATIRQSPVREEEQEEDRECGDDGLEGPRGDPGRLLGEGQDRARRRLSHARDGDAQHHDGERDAGPQEHPTRVVVRPSCGDGRPDRGVDGDHAEQHDHEQVELAQGGRPGRCPEQQDGGQDQGADEPDAPRHERGPSAQGRVTRHGRNRRPGRRLGEGVVRGRGRSRWA